MKILIISATFNEIKPFCDKFNFEKSGTQKTINGNIVEILITQPGILATAFALGELLQEDAYDLLVNVGICGALSKTLKIGQVVNIISEELGDFGAENGTGFIPASELNIIDKQNALSNQIIKPTIFSHLFLDEFYKAKGLTANKVHGNSRSIAKLKKRSTAEVESMEGAACFYAAINAQTPIVQLRSISNYVKKRDTSKWDIPLAIKSLNESIIAFLKTL